MTAIGLYRVRKDFKHHDCRSRWLRRDVVGFLRGDRGQDGWWTVLRGINLEIEQGETVAILGRNASGKSTLLKLMADILQPTEGTIVRYGSICALLDLGTGFHEDLTGRENAFINGVILGLPRGHLRAIMPEIERFAELEGFMDTPLRYYSAGMWARLGFAVAMSADPDIFLIDEVLAVGDEGFRQKCYARLGGLVERGVTIVMVSHDVGAVQRLCRRGVWIHDGTICADGPIHQVCKEYVEHFDAGLYTRPVR